MMDRSQEEEWKVFEDFSKLDPKYSGYSYCKNHLMNILINVGK